MQHCFEEIQVLISMNVDPHETNTDFPYLGSTFAYNNIDWAALYQNISKAQRWWGVVAKVLVNIVVTVWEQ